MTAPSATHNTAAAALQHVLSRFAQPVAATSARIGAVGDHVDRVVLYRLERRRVLVVGDGAVAAAVRGCLPCDGWRQCPMPAPGTPLTGLLPLVGPRVFNALAREGFTLVEQVAVLPDVVLLEIRGVGELSLQTVRRAVARIRVPYYPDEAAVVFEAPELREMHDLLAMLAVYAQVRGQRDLVERAEAMIAVLQRPGG